jgi:hypothetical protein
MLHECPPAELPTTLARDLGPCIPSKNAISACSTHAHRAMPGNKTAGEVGALLRAHVLVGRPSTAALLVPGQYRTAAPGAHVTVSLSTQPNRLSVRGPASATDLLLLLTDVPAGKVRRVR